ncbi:MAG: efflux RND transporter permease subunit [Gammaproteobacteria bacterium]|nr:efflux RND transporter permease subunit [Gammaproteobacteria bacterium]MBU0848283.1 efflux RND transporter permease subunit [Gammaproteobacteria bacterium]MBU1266976.1 efflux RND transporter permease subunit [Gammaproteobacteria bacterium]MBU1529583.1 efflux RND transporter permease subunit [Gammaproteobacteria bacterium]MBU1781164.1 efflux RND transporter permease subunit [Gammaproteobacteria bacterium]
MNAASRRRIGRSGPLAWMTKNTVAANILMWVCLIGGVFGFMNMTKEVFPEFELDLVTISVAYPGASPEDVEQGIVLAVEEAISGVEGIVEVNATANESSANILVEIDESEDAQAVYDKIKQEVDRITTFPGDSEVPNVTLTARKRGVVTLVVYGDTDELSLRNLAEEVRDGLLQNPGITQVDLNETREQEIHIEVPESRLNAYGLTLQGIAENIRSNVVEVSGGSISTLGGEILLRVSERRDFANQFAQLPIVSPVGGTPLKLGDIATVRDGFQDVDKYATFNGKPSIEISVSRIGEQTPIGISEATLEALEKIRPLMPQGVDIAVVTDRSDTYKQRQELLAKNALMGLVLVMVLLTIFLDWKLAFWVTMGIPVSFLGAMLLLPLFGVTFNMISMFAFIVALGIVVDDAIVAGENIYEYRQQGMGLLDASIQGARDVAVPVTFSILTNIAAFAPLLFVPGFLGKIWGVIPLVVCTVFIVSLMEAIFILPAHLAHSRESKSRFHDWQQRFSKGFSRFIELRYTPVVVKCVEYRYMSMAAGIALMILVISWPVSGRMGFELFPQVESDLSEVRAILPLGSTREQVNRVRDKIVASALKTVEATGGEEQSTGIYASVNENTITVKTYLTPPGIRPVPTAEFTNQWRTDVGTIAGVETMRFAADSGGPGSGPAFTVQLSHRNVDTLRQASEALARELSNYPMVSEIDDGFQNGKEQFSFTLKEEARRLGLTSNEIGRQVRAAFFGSEALRQQRGRNEIKVLVMRPETERTAQTDVRDLLIRTPQGTLVPLHALVNFDDTRAFASITRRDGRRTISVTANVNPRNQAQQVQSATVQDLMPKLMADYPGLSYSFAGRQQDFSEALGGLGKGFLVALLLIYVLLAIPFKSYLQPFIVMLAIPFGIFGAILGHLMMGYSISIVSMMGILALAGVVVNDSLVMVDYANQKVREGMSPYDAICTSGVRRFRPIMLTTISTFGGLAPMIFETSRQAKFMIPMAISLGYGILFATAITLLLVPCLYLMIDDVRRLMGTSPGREPDQIDLTKLEETRAT